MFILLKATYTFNTIPIKILMACFTDLEQMLQNFIWNQKDPENLGNLKKKEQS